MKGMNEQSKPSLFERVATSVGNKLAGIPIAPFTCVILTFHEPEIPEEIILEMSNID